MKTGQMHDLSFDQLEDGTIRLEQKDYCGESSVITLHPCQLRHVAESLGVLEPTAPTRATWPRGFTRRMEGLRAQAHDLWALLDSVPCFPTQHEPTEDVIAASELLAAIDDLLGDFDIQSAISIAEPLGAQHPCSNTDTAASESKPSQGPSAASNESSELRLRCC